MLTLINWFDVLHKLWRTTEQYIKNHTKDVRLYWNQYAVFDQGHLVKKSSYEIIKSGIIDLPSNKLCYLFIKISLKKESYKTLKVIAFGKSLWILHCSITLCQLEDFTLVFVGKRDEGRFQRTGK